MARFSLFILVAGAGAASIATAAPKAPRAPGGEAALLQKVMACRSLAEDKARLACFDGSLAELDASQAKGDIVVIDRAQVKETHRALFGLNLPKLPFLSAPKSAAGKSDDDDDLQELTGKVRSFGRTADGGWTVTLEDGARWEQTDSVMLGLPPRPGSTVLIRKAAFGSYKMQIDKGPFFRARRVN